MIIKGYVNAEKIGSFLNGTDESIMMYPDNTPVILTTWYELHIDTDKYNVSIWKSVSEVYKILLCVEKK